MEHGQMPQGVALQRSTDEFTDESVPAGLLRAHRVAAGVWGRLRVMDGALRFVWESTEPAGALELATGDAVVIPPDTPHRVEPAPGCRFLVEFYR
ncbi:MAG TPA: DUF1971 domain-containing protein [Microthrixaceae bacterium]|nr:DUF1971 domain-containing protein [Microthrixaceae bacterium]